MARSSTKSEYVKLVWIQGLLNEQTIPVLWYDNTSAGNLASNPIFHAQTKHIEVDVSFCP